MRIKINLKNETSNKTGEQDELRCPVCQKLIFDKEGCYPKSKACCSHFIMGYDPACDPTFYRISKLVAKIVKGMQGKELDDKEIVDALIKRYDNKSHIILYSDPEYLGGCMYTQTYMIFKIS